MDVRRALNAYRAAFASKNIEAIQRVQTLSPKDVTEIKGAVDYRVALDKLDIRFSPDGRQATVNAEMTKLITQRHGQSQRITLAVFTLEKRGRRGPS